MGNPGILPRRDVRSVMKPAGEQVLPARLSGIGQPITDCCSGLFGNLELDWSACFLLDDRGAIPDPAADAHVVDLKPRKVATPQLAVDGQIEQCEIASGAVSSLSRTRIAQTSFGLSGRFWPMRQPLFQGIRCNEVSAASMLSMVVSSEGRPHPPQLASSAIRSGKTYRRQL
jgi:hypothetical protein